MTGRTSADLRIDEGHLVYRDEAGRTRQVPFSRGAAIPFESALPIRQPRSYRGKRGIVGHVFFATTQRSLITDSRLEMDQVLSCDFDPAVQALSTQPFRIVQAGWTHVPDLFARLTDGSGHVYDVKPLAEQEDETNQLVFERSRSACLDLGWEYSVVGELPEPLRTNLRLLAGFRRAAYDPGGLVDAITAACRAPKTIAELDALHPVRALVRPIVLHLIWHRVLCCDIESRLLDRGTPLATRGHEAHGL